MNAMAGCSFQQVQIVQPHQILPISLWVSILPNWTRCQRRLLSDSSSAVLRHEATGCEQPVEPTAMFLSENSEKCDLRTRTFWKHTQIKEIKTSTRGLLSASMSRSAFQECFWHFAILYRPCAGWCWMFLRCFLPYVTNIYTNIVLYCFVIFCIILFVSGNKRRACSRKILTHQIHSIPQFSWCPCGILRAGGLCSGPNGWWDVRKGGRVLVQKVSLCFPAEFPWFSLKPVKRNVRYMTLEI